MVKLIIEDDEGKTTVVPLIRDEITIGRKEGNTIRLTERNVSRRHAKLVKHNGAIFIEDLESYNGIKVNGNKVAGRVAVTEGDRIQIGDYVLGLKLEGGLAEVSGVKTVELPGRAAEDAPTEPFGDGSATEAAEEDEAALSMEEMGRMVCVSSNFAGQEWYLDKPVMVIGRTDDNDIVVNHRSISRNHARVHYEGNRYTIRDLDSANGVRINGEEYNKVEMRRGDHIDLGHVRLRFVAPGEDFDFARDATVVDISKPGKSRGLIWAAVSAVAVLAVGLLIWQLIGRRPDDSGTATTPSDAGVVASADSQSGTTSTAPDSTQLLTLINEAVTNEQWDEALANCAKLDATGQQAAKNTCGKATAEKDAQQVYEKFRAAATRNDHKEALVQHGKIPATSVYKARDAQALADAKAKYLAGAYKEIDDLVAKKECKQADEAAAGVVQVVADDTDAQQRASRCTTTVVQLKPAKPSKPTGGRTTPSKPKRPPEKPPVKPPVKRGPTEDDKRQAKVLFNQAQGAYVNAEYRQTVKLAKKVLRLVPNDVMSIQLIGASSCYLKDLRQAKWAFKRLPRARQQMLRQVCQRKGLDL